MKKKTLGAPQSKPSHTPDEDDFAALDAWAKNLKLTDGRKLNSAEREEERHARKVGRPRKPRSAKSKRIMISMTPALAKAAGKYAERMGRTLSGLIAESLEEKINRKAS